MIQSDDGGQYLRHISMAEYRQIQARSGELRSLLRDGVTILRACRMLGLDPTGAVLEFIADVLADG